MNWKTCFALLASLSVAALQVQELHQEYERAFDFSKYKTFSWVPSEEIPLAAHAPEISPKEADAEIRSAIEKVLAAKGFRKAENGSADFQVNYFGIVTARLKEEKVPYSLSETFSPWHFAREGKLTIDVVDGKQQILVWRGWSVTTVEARGEQVRQTIREVVHKTLQPFPPK
ncbi:MAG: DUF4136 domain-containing protein [Acidobacteriota bacterium]